MYNGLSPLLPTPMERDDPDGTTAWSDDVGLPGDGVGHQVGTGRSASQ